MGKGDDDKFMSNQFELAAGSDYPVRVVSGSDFGEAFDMLCAAPVRDMQDCHTPWQKQQHPRSRLPLCNCCGEQVELVQPLAVVLEVEKGEKTPQQAGMRPLSLSLSDQHVPVTYHPKAMKLEQSHWAGYSAHSLHNAVFLACNWHQQEWGRGLVKTVRNPIWNWIVS